MLRAWVVGVMIIVSKLSDIFGRKPVFLISLGIFLVFSAACSAAQTLTQLYVENSIFTSVYLTV